MRLRNLLFVLLLCMTVGVLGTSCTGDDGAQGPPGPPGPPGPAAEPMDGDIQEPTAFYDFLKSWGSKDGEIACSDPILTGMGPLPGPELEDIPTSKRTDATDDDPAVNGTNLNAMISVNCGVEALGILSVAADWGDVAEIAGNTIAGDNNNIVLWKAGRAKIAHEGDPIRLPEDDFGLAKEIEVTKYFVGGPIAASIQNKGADEGFERAILNNQCNVGTSPPAIMGTWKAVKEEAKITSYKDSQRLDSDNNGTPDAALVVTSLLKVCVRLDAHPGATKCYVDELKNDGTRAKSVNLYDDTGIVTPPVVAMDKLPNADATQFGDLFSDDDAAGTSDLSDEENLCALFSQGVKP